MKNTIFFLKDDQQEQENNMDYRVVPYGQMNKDKLEAFLADYKKLIEKHGLFENKMEEKDSRMQVINAVKEYMFYCEKKGISKDDMETALLNILDFDDQEKNK